MVNGAFNDLAAARDFGFEQGDPRLKLGYRKRVEILAREAGGGIVGAAGKIVFHDAKVGRGGGVVKRSGMGGCSADYATAALTSRGVAPIQTRF